MLGYAIDFTPPMEGLEGTFNTFRLGKVWTTRLKPGDVVYLIDKKRATVIGRAVVEHWHIGPLKDMAKEHAAMNHNQIAYSVRGASARLMEGIRKRYGPHIAHDNKLTTVIYLRRMNE